MKTMCSFRIGMKRAAISSSLFIRIYTDLVMVEKFLHYKHRLLDWVHDLVPKLNADKDRKLTIAERCRRRWLHNSGSAYYEWEDEDNEYE